MRRRFVSLICGYYGMGNLGDELLLSSMLRELRGVGVDRNRIAVLSGDPDETSSRYGVAAVDRWSPSDVWSACRSSDNCLFGGGGLFQDATSFRSLMYYGMLINAAKAAGSRPWLFGNSLGPFKSSLARIFTAVSLKGCRVLALRDEHSMSEALEMGLDPIRCPDPVMSVDVPKGDGGSVLINLRPWNGDLELRTAKSIAYFIEKTGLDSIGVAMCPQDRDLMESLRHDGVLPLSDVVEPFGSRDPIWSSGCMSVGMRLHFCILSSLAGLPGVAVPYDPKVVDFGRSVGYRLWDGRGKLPPAGTPDEVWLSACREGVSETFEKSWREVCRR